MASKRKIKKEIADTCGALATECIFAIEYVPGIDIDAMSQIIVEIAGLQDHAISRCSVDFDKIPSSFESGHDYTTARNNYFNEAFRNLRKEFNETVGKIVKEMNALLPEEQRAANKAAVNN